MNGERRLDREEEAPTGSNSNANYTPGPSGGGWTLGLDSEADDG